MHIVEKPPYISKILFTFINIQIYIIQVGRVWLLGMCAGLSS